MKKIKTMRFAYLLLAVTLLTACAISGTFAKYIKTGSGMDSARVAKFGVTITAEKNANAFAISYRKDKKVVVSSNTKVVAPGTGGVLSAPTVSGTPEVSINVTNKATINLGDGWTVDGKFYCPLKIGYADSIENGVSYLKGTDYNSAEAFGKAIGEMINSTENFTAGTELKNYAGKLSNLPAIFWDWDFEGNDDAKDTALGTATTPPTISITVETTVTQTQESTSTV